MCTPHRPTTLALLAAVLLTARASAAGPTTLPSFAEPALSPDGAEIAFVSGGDIWTVPAAGGTAHLLVSNGANDARPLYSPDGRSLAFVSDRTGNGDLYVLNLDAGDVRRLTWDDGREEPDAFSPDGKWLYYSTSSNDVGNSNRDIYRVSVDGGTPMPVIADRFANEFNAAPAPDGGDGGPRLLAFSAGGIMSREWNRRGHAHAGESAVWLATWANDAATPAFEKLTPDGGRDLWPMWSADRKTIYYLSDRDGGQNLYAVQLGEPGAAPAAPHLLTHFKAGHTAWPTISRDGKTIVCERDFAVWTVDTGTGDAREVPIKLRGASAGSGAEPERHQFTSGISETSLSPDGRKVAFAIHGQIFAGPARGDADAVRITHTRGIEAHPVWSRDSRRLAYVSDRDGPHHLFLYEFDDGKEYRLTRGGADDDTAPQFTPDGLNLAFERNGSELRLIDVLTRRERLLADHQSFGVAPFDNAAVPFVFSPRGDYVAFSSVAGHGFSNCYLVPIDASAPPRQVTFVGNAYARAISWSPDGSFLLYGTGQRTEDYQLARIDLIPRVPRFREDQFQDLFREQPRPTNPRPTQPNPPDPTPAPATAPTTASVATPAAAASQPTTRRFLPNFLAPRTPVVFEGIRQRLTLLPVGLDVDFQTISPDGKQVLLVGSSGGQQNLYTYAIDDYAAAPAVARQLTSSPGGKSHVQFSSDGREVYYLDAGRIFAVPLDTRLPRSVNVVAEMDTDFATEKLTVFRQVWTYINDNFVDPKFNGIDWPAVRDAYQPRVAGARTPDELRRILGYMVGELNASHVGVFPPARNARTSGRLGLRFDPVEYEQSGRLKVAEVIPLGPAAVAGIKVGEFLLGVDGTRVTAHTNLDELLNLKVAKRVVLRVSSKSSRVGDLAYGRNVPLLPIDTAAEKTLLYRSWIESRRDLVDRLSGGRLGYVHIADMTESALARLNTDLDSETLQKDGVVIDVRGNTGGFVNGFAIDVFARRNYLTMQHRGWAPAPSRITLGQRALLAPTVLVTNRSTYSDGEDFTEAYRALKLGKVVGEPTGGSVIFTSTVNLLDGTRLGLPTTAVYGNDGRTLEGHPRPVDVAVRRPVGEWYAQTDVQLDAAVTTLLKQLGPAKAPPATRPAPTSVPSTVPTTTLVKSPTTRPAPTTAPAAQAADAPTEPPSNR